MEAGAFRPVNVALLCSGEALLRLLDRGDGLGDEVHTADLRDHRGQHPLDGRAPPSPAGLAGQTQRARRARGFIVAAVHEVTPPRRVQLGVQAKTKTKLMLKNLKELLLVFNPFMTITLLSADADALEIDLNLSVFFSAAPEMWF